ncbi:15051_t:CDS:1, partial [Acaulospora colombiana]
DDLETLHSAILVSRQWCQNIMPILWKRPFTIKAENLSLSRLSKIIPVYLKLLSEDIVSVEFKERFFYFFNEEIKKPIFNYSSFLRELDIKKLYDAISESSEIFMTDNKLDTEIELAKLSFAQTEEKEELEWTMETVYSNETYCGQLYLVEESTYNGHVEHESTRESEI